MNQVGKSSAGLKPLKLSNYIDAAEEYRNKISDLHSKLGVESPVAPSSLNAVKSTLNAKPSLGAQLADHLSKNSPSIIGSAAANVAGSAAGSIAGGVPGAIAGGRIADKLTPYFEKAIGRPLTDSGVNTILRMLGQGQTEGIPEALDHAKSVTRGGRMMDAAAKSLFAAGKYEGLNYSAHARDKDKIDKFVKQGGVPAQMQNEIQAPQQASTQQTPKFAQGGMVQLQQPELPETNKVPPKESEGHLAQTFPAQNTMLQGAKARVYNYLNSIRPQEAEASTLPFDSHHDDADKKRKYDRALGIAASPLSIMQHVKDGSLHPDDLKHFNAMWPEVHNQLSKKVTAEVIKAQQEGTKPPYKTRQALSMFLGSSLDSTLTPMSIQAAQSSFMPAQPPQGAAPGVKGNKKNTSKLGELPKQYTTPGQAAESRMTKDS